MLDALSELLVLVSDACGFSAWKARFFSYCRLLLATLRYYPGSDLSTTTSYAPKLFRIQANKGLQSNPVVDCISMAHPSLVNKQEIEAVGVPTQILAPETDTQLTPELKEFCNKTIPALGLEYDYQYFPGLVHGFATRGDMTNPLQKKGLERAKNAAVHWFLQHLHE
jgi:hypothetical protein